MPRIRMLMVLAPHTYLASKARYKISFPSLHLARQIFGNLTSPVWKIESRNSNDCMAPIAMESDAEDNFVRTISDDDANFPLSEEEEDSTPRFPAKAAQKGKKRKHDLFDGEETLAQTNGKKGKKQKTKSKATAESPATAGNASLDDEDQGWTAQGEDDGAMDSDFEFQIGDMNTGVVEDFDGWGLNENGTGATAPARGDKKGVDIDELIARRRQGVQEGEKQDGDKKVLLDDVEDKEEDDDAEEGFEDEEEDETLAEDAFGMGANLNDEDGVDGDTEEDQDSDTTSDDEAIADPMPNPDDDEAGASSAEEKDDPEEMARREAFFAPEDKASKSKASTPSSNSFQNMSLSRPILRGLASVGFATPTPIQAKTIPVALLGKDVVGGAVTGSGKTAAFIIPILERLLYRPKKVPTSRVAILMPTRELAVQCFNVAKKLASFTDVTFCQLVGGFSLREQESVLRSRPDVIIATPGRFIDHMRNSASFTLDTLEILVLDEADRMLEDGFADELNEILSTIPKSRQTLLFSATMTDRVDKLIRLGMNRPVRLMVDARKQTVGTLIQEFVRLRPGREDKRLGYLMYLCSNVFTERVIIFFRQKKEAHRVRIIFGLCGIKAAELHGSMSQEQRISSLQSFRTATTTHLLATDLASRGLDIPHVSVVLNYESPQSHEIYLHRVGRTARAGRAGRACTIAAEPDRRVVKQAVKAGKAQGAKIVSRVIDAALADQWAAKIDAMEDEVESIMKEEKEMKLLSQTDMSISKAENIMTHEDEIHSRPKRTWFESEKEKLIAKKKGGEELNGRVGLGTKPKAGKLSNKEKKRLDDGRERGEGRVWKKGRGDAEEMSRSKGKGKTDKGKSKSKDGAKGGSRGGGRGGSRGRGGGGGQKPGNGARGKRR